MLGLDFKDSYSDGMERSCELIFQSLDLLLAIACVEIVMCMIKIAMFISLNLVELKYSN
jgi:hypothetical protein